MAHTLPTTPIASTYETRRNKGNANGYAGLGSDGFVPTSQLASGVASEMHFSPWKEKWKQIADQANNKDVLFI